MDFDQNAPEERASFKLFKRCDIRDTASFFRCMKYREGIEGNDYTIEDRPGTFRGHSIEVEGAILESILGLGAIFEEHGFTELEDMPELVVDIEEGLKTHKRNIRAHNPRRTDWLSDEYGEIWGFEDVPCGFPDYQVQ
eukprot:1011180-Heterocapsa_arctica.AAC.1